MKIIILIFAFWTVIFGEQNRSTLGLESYLGGDAGMAGEIELAKIRIENLKALKAELQAEAARLRKKANMEAPVYVSSDDPQVGELLAQISALKNEIVWITKNSNMNSSGNSNMNSSENSSKNSIAQKDPKSTQGVYIFGDDKKPTQKVAQNSN